MPAPLFFQNNLTFVIQMLINVFYNNGLVKPSYGTVALYGPFVFF